MLHKTLVYYLIRQIKNVCTHAILPLKYRHRPRVPFAQFLKERNAHTFFIGETWFNQRVQLVVVANHNKLLRSQDRPQRQRFNNLARLIHNTVVELAELAHALQQLIRHLQTRCCKDLVPFNVLVYLLDRRVLLSSSHVRMQLIFNAFEVVGYTDEVIKVSCLQSDQHIVDSLVSKRDHQHFFFHLR